MSAYFRPGWPTIASTSASIHILVLVVERQRFFYGLQRQAEATYHLGGSGADYDDVGYQVLDDHISALDAELPGIFPVGLDF